MTPAPSAALVLRPLRADDLPAVLRIQREAYGDAYQESAGVLGRKLQLAPEGCWLAEAGGEGVGYVLAHPWSDGAPPLHAEVERLPVGAEHGFVHDLAVSPCARGTGVGGRLLARVADWSHAAGHRGLRLVALADAVAFWRRLGFSGIPFRLPEGYGAGAVLMQRR